jgi:hypothetical protein
LRFGAEFDRQIRQLVDDQIGIRQAARWLHVDPRTVRLHAAKLNLNAIWAAASVSMSVVCDSGGRRKAWMDLQQKYPNLGRKALSKLEPALFMWLYRHDKEWLVTNQPAAKSPAEFESSALGRVLTLNGCSVSQIWPKNPSGTSASQSNFGGNLP